MILMHMAAVIVAAVLMSGIAWYDCDDTSIEPLKWLFSLALLIYAIINCVQGQ